MSTSKERDEIGQVEHARCRECAQFVPEPQLSPDGVTCNRCAYQLDQPKPRRLTMETFQCPSCLSMRVDGHEEPGAPEILHLYCKECAHEWNE